MRLGLQAALVAAVGGWAAAGYLYFIAMPALVNTHKVAYTLDLIDHFEDSPAHQVYMQLGDDLKPWWDQIEELQRKIASATDDDARAKLISDRDETLIAYLNQRSLTSQTDLLINAFSPFKRCLDVDACDDDVLRKSISIDVKRIYRTFRPYIEAVRSQPGKESFGRDLEDLFFRFVA